VKYLLESILTSPVTDGRCVPAGELEQLRGRETGERNEPGDNYLWRQRADCD
jgi:hypothetical protein